MPGKRKGWGKQETAAGRDTNIARRDQLIVNFGMADAVELVVPGLLPRDVPRFTGREGELDRLAGLALGGSVMVTAIGGTAGVGKTALAVHAAHRLLPEFPDGHLYVDLRGYTAGQSLAEPGEVLEVFLRHLGVPAEEVPRSVEERSGLLRQLLARRRVLMLLDNAGSEAQVRPLLPGAGRSLVLITSRSMLPGLEVDERISLDVLANDEAVNLLAALIGKERTAAEPQAIAQLADWCGRLPLALRIAGQLLAVHSSWPVAKLAQMLVGERNRLERLSAGDLQVRAVFEVSYKLLDDDDARMFRLLGLHPGSTFGVAAAASIAGIEPGGAVPIMNRLVEAYLVTEDASGRFGIHDLLRLFARSTCQEVDDKITRDAAEGRLVRHYVELAAILTSCLDPDLRALAEASEHAGLLPRSSQEALVLFETERSSLLATLGLAAQRSWDEQVCQLGECMGRPLMRLRYLTDLLAVAEAALAAARHNAAGTSAEASALSNLGEAYRELRRFEDAIACYREALVICRETDDWSGKSLVLSNLGTAYQELRRFEEAIPCYREALVICRETDDWSGKSLVLSNLGTAYQELRRFEEAITYYREALTIYLVTGDRHGESLMFNNLGAAYRELRQFEVAITCYREALAAYQVTGYRHGEGSTLSNLGIAYQELDAYRFRRHLYYATSAIVMSIPDSNSDGDRYPSAFCIRLRL